jgi:Apea-like HEPN
LNELLRNRCAYLVGKNQSQREEILTEFADIYKVRSEIVHRGKSRLSKQERQLFYRLRWLCGRAIQEEINLLQANPR